MAVRKDNSTPDQFAAHALLSELRTRIATQPLPYQYGVEARALESLWEIFALTRQAMKDNPGCEIFARMATNMLNVDLRPFTAKWHQEYKSGVLDSRDGASRFRIELRGIQEKLAAFSLTLQKMAYGKSLPDKTATEVLKDSELKSVFTSVRFGIEQSSSKWSLANESVDGINKNELEAIRRRRAHYGIDSEDGMNAVGLALSGGGIRSATFCLGVVQVLAERDLMKDFDYLSTVSGGGYVGSLITSTIGESSDFLEMAKPHGPDTTTVRHVRQNAKYLSAANLKQRWIMVTGTLAGLLLNWTAPLCMVTVLALLFSWLDPTVSITLLAHMVAVLGALTLLCVPFYGVTRKSKDYAGVADIALAAMAVATTVVFVLLLIEHGYRWFVDGSASHWFMSGIFAGSVLSTPVLFRFLPLISQKKARELLFKIALLAAGLMVPVFFVGIFYLLRSIGSEVPNSAPASTEIYHYLSGPWILAAFAIITALFAIFPLDVNLTGPHKLYRDRLAKTFVAINSEKPKLLSETNSNDHAPYHLINAAVNLPSSTSLTLRDRRCDFFLFSKHWIGSPAVGYSETTTWKSGGEQIDLATAMAISGAAASPHMGLASMPSLASIMTLLNIRLGYWITRPSARSGTPGFLCLLKEMTGFGMTENSRWLNLSDGGHIENMGVYELLRRRCKFIVCVDGEADRESTFHGQLTLVRHAQIDFGVRIEPRLEGIRQDVKSKLSRTHFHLFRVHYPEEAPGRPKAMGLLLYLKLSLTGDESELLKRYRATSSDFPHESTLDQFYDEEQFEVYRQLGVHVAEGAFSPALMIDNESPSNVFGWFRQLSKCLLEPSN